MQEKESNSKKIIMVSACLLGIKCRYDGESKLNKDVIDYCKNAIIIPFCPEQLGGLPTPRPKSTLTAGGKVINENNKNVTLNFLKGAEETLKIIHITSPNEIILKESSPSCGLLETNINWKREKGSGITASLLKNKTNLPLKTEKLL